MVKKGLEKSILVAGCKADPYLFQRSQKTGPVVAEWARGRVRGEVVKAELDKGLYRAFLVVLRTLTIV